MINNIKAVVEVKCFNLLPEEMISPARFSTNLRDEEAWIEKFNLTLTSMKRQDAVDREWYIGTIHLDFALLFISHRLILEPEFIEKTEFKNTEIDCVILFPQKTGDLESNRIPIFFAQHKNLYDIYSRSVHN